MEFKMVNFRIDPELHRELKICSAETGVSMTRMLTDSLKAEIRLQGIIMKQKGNLRSIKGTP